MGLLRPQRLVHHVSFMLSVSKQRLIPSSAKLSTDIGGMTYSRRKYHDSSGSDSESSGSEGKHQSNAVHEEEDLEIKEKILQASLQFVPEHGWSQKSLASGAETVGFPKVAHGMFPRGGVELINFFHISSKNKLSEILAKDIEKAKAEGLAHPPTEPFLEKAVETRLRMIIPYIDVWPKAMAVQTLPQNAPEALSNLAMLVDEIWYLAGDTSADFNWYTKRLSLAAAYKSTEIYMIQDRSEDYTETWSYLSRRLKDLEKFGKFKHNVESSVSVIPDLAVGMCMMARNILGMSRINR